MNSGSTRGSSRPGSSSSPLSGSRGGRRRRAPRSRSFRPYPPDCLRVPRMGRVAAGVGEEPALPLHDALVAVLFETARATGADPTPVEEVLLLPPEHGLGGVRFGGEGAAAAEGV